MNTTSLAGPKDVSIIVGAGGRGGESSPTNANERAGSNGLESQISHPGIIVPAPGGGYGGGGGHGLQPGGNGSSGGGGAGSPGNASGGTASGTNSNPPQTVGPTPTNGWGYDGSNNTDFQRAGGGGGANSAGNETQGGRGTQLPTTFRDVDQFGDGGNGFGTIGPTNPTLTGADTSGKFWVAGGGGAGGSYPAPGGAPGTGNYGGGAGGAEPGSLVKWAGAGYGGGERSPTGPAPLAAYPSPGTPGTIGTGGGGGGGSGSHGPGGADPSYGGKGGSGIILIAYPT
jgi:hypothetical protein